MATKLKAETEFEGVCPRCEGDGRWQQRDGYPCRGCDATGKIRVAIVLRGLGSRGFYVISAKGNVTQERYYAAAVLTAPRRRFDCGATVGSGWWELELEPNPVGAACAVYGFGGGELTVRLPGGGFSSTGEQRTAKGEAIVTAVRVTEPAAAAAIEGYALKAVS